MIPSMTYQWNPRLHHVVAAAGPAGVVVDFGAGGRRVASNVLTVDFVRGPETDYVVDLTSEPTPFADGSVDVVICTGVLEHVVNPDTLISEAARILRVGGSLHVEVPFMEVYHEDPIDERRFTAPGLARFLEVRGFHIEQKGTHIGPTVA